MRVFWNATWKYAEMLGSQGWTLWGVWFEKSGWFIGMSKRN